MMVEKIFFALSLIEILHILSLSLVMKAFFMVIRARPFLSAFNENLFVSLSPTFTKEIIELDVRW